jgi:hypothetical protein
MSFNSNRSQGRQPPIIRAGLSVQVSLILPFQMYFTPFLLGT